MILVTGGAFQGKKEYVRQAFGLKEADFTDGKECAWEAVYEAKAVTHFHEYIRRSLEAGREVSNLAKELYRRNPEVILVVNELGSGVVPVDAFDRNYRETTGRVCCELAKYSGEVHRVTCGIGRKIKESGSL
jgi:hypothetical protein